MLITVHGCTSIFPLRRRNQYSGNAATLQPLDLIPVRTQVGGFAPHTFVVVCPFQVLCAIMTENNRYHQPRKKISCLQDKEGLWYRQEVIDESL